MDSELDLALKGTTMYIKAHTLAVKYINKHFGKLPDFFWIRNEHKMHSFDDMIFGYKNQVFSVLLRFYHNDAEELEYKAREKRFLQAAKENNLIPCILRIDITGNNKDHPKICSKLVDLNLLDINNRPLNPLELASDERVMMSKYEIHHLAIVYIANKLEEKGYEVSMYYDDPNVPEFFPQIWFYDENGLFCWVIVRYYTDEKQVTIPDPRKADRLHVQMNGYFAPVLIEYEDKKPYRGFNSGGIYARHLKDVITQIHTARAI